jgi:uncharacterized protein YjiS (DUF1127 family)
MAFAVQDLAYRAYAAIPADRFPTIKARLGRVLGTLFSLADRARSRRMLAELDERLLRDIGLSRADIDREIEKPFWRP